MHTNGTWLRQAALAALATGAAWGIGHALAGRGAEALWPGIALLPALMILAGNAPVGAAAVLCGGLAATAALHLWSGTGVLTTAAHVGGTGAAGLLAFLLLRSQGEPRRLLDHGRGVLTLVGAAAVAALVPGIVTMATAPRGTAWFPSALQSFGAAALGILVITPAILIVARMAEPAVRRRLVQRGLATLPLPLVLVAGTTALAFSQTGVPLAFMVGPAMLLATFRLRVPGAVLGMAIVALISSYATAMGHGPFAVARIAPVDRMLLLDLFLACSFLSALPVAVMLSERDRRADECHKLAERFRAVVENAGEVIFQMDALGRWTYLNPAWQTLTGRRVEETIGRSWLDAVAEDDRAFAAAQLTPVLAGTVAAASQSGRLDTPDGPRWVEIFVRVLHDAGGAPAGATGTLRDVHEAKRREERTTRAYSMAEERAREAAHLASTDELTGLANRRAFLRQLDREIAAAAEFGWPLSVAMFDVDHFKQVNDVHGHAVGDRVLRQVADRAGLVVRGADLVGRLGGEEFGILMPGASAEDATLVAERLRQAIAAPFPPGTGLPAVTVSVGLAERVERRSAERLLAVADEALYRAKQDGRNRVRVST